MTIADETTGTTYGGTGTSFVSFNPLSIITNLISAGINLWTNYRNTETQKAINEANIKAQERENTITRQREDNAHVREVADLENAGLSPLAATAGANASSGGVMAAEAPQMDTASMIDALARISSEGLEAERIKEEKRKNRATEDEATATRLQQEEQFEKAQELTEKIENTRLKTEVQNVQKELEQRSKELEAEKDRDNYKALEEKEKRSWDFYHACNNQFGGILPYHVVTDPDEYDSELQTFTKTWNDFLDWMVADSKTPSGDSPNENFVYGQNGGLEVPRSAGQTGDLSTIWGGIRKGKNESVLGNQEQTAQLKRNFTTWRERSGGKAQLNCPVYIIKKSDLKIHKSN